MFVDLIAVLLVTIIRCVHTMVCELVIIIELVLNVAPAPWNAGLRLGLQIVLAKVGLRLLESGLELSKHS